MDFNDVFSPVVNDITFRVMLLAKIVWNLDSYLFDVETAFLLGTLEEEIYMEVPPGMECEADECLLLLKTIYGLVQSARQFFKLWTQILKGMGFEPSPADPCLFVKGKGEDIVIICLYVDDGYALGREATLLQFFADLKKHLTIKVEKSMGDYLSCEVKFDGGDGDKKTCAWLGQPHMVKKIEKTFGDKVKSLPVYKTPGTPGFSVVRPREEEPTIDEAKQSEYRSGVGMLLYLIKHSRPDLSNAIRELTKCLDRATPAAYKEMMRVIKYVLDTKSLGLKIQPKFPKDSVKWELYVYSDSDWAGDKDNRRSVSGYVMFLCGVPIAWRSKQQKTVALSSSEAEFVAASEAVKDILFVVQVLESLNIAVEKPVTVRVDNMGAIFMSGNNSSSARTRHVDTRWHFVRELVEDKVIEVVFVRSKDNKSDMYTKNLNGELFDNHVGDMVWDKSLVK